jgi:hypothetical protein
MGDRSVRSMTMIGPAILFVFVLTASTSEAQEGVQSHIQHVMESSAEAPDGLALLTLALGEAAIAGQYAGYAAGGSEEPGDLESMKLYTGHVLHAVDPSRIDEGPGLGMGVMGATERIIYHVEMAAASGDAPEGVRTHAEHVAYAARNTLTLAERMIELISQVQMTESAEEASQLTDELETLSRRLTTGFDADGDGSVGWREGEGGLVQVRQHMDLMVAAAGA